MLECYEYRNDDLVISTDDTSCDLWVFICNQFDLPEPKNVLSITVKSYDVYMYEGGR